MHLIKVSLFILLCVWFTNAAAKSVSAIALFDGRAMLSIDGAKAKIIREGESFKGVTLVSSDTSQAVIELAGQRKTLKLNGTTILNERLGGEDPETSFGEVTLYENLGGFFLTDGYVDGSRTRFLVDTGANLIVFSGQQAQQIGVKYQEGRRSVANTASGQAPMYLVELDKVSIGSIELRNIQAGVIEGSYPQVPLLGMSFLGKLEISKRGDKMTLKKRGGLY